MVSDSATLEKTAVIEENNLLTFERYLLADQQFAKQYQPLVDKFIARVAEHNLDITPKTREALEDYFFSYIARGADPSQIDFESLSTRSPDNIRNLIEQIPDKLTPESRQRFAELGEQRAEHARWNGLFENDKDTITVSLSSAKSLREKIDDEIEARSKEADAKYTEALTAAETNAGKSLEEAKALAKTDAKSLSPEDKALLAVGKDYQKYRIKTLEDGQPEFDEKGNPLVEVYDRIKEQWKPGPKLTSLLSEDLLSEYNDLGADKVSRQAAMRVIERSADASAIPYGEIGVKADEYDPDTMRVVISRDPQRVGESSSGQSWFSCMAEKDGANFRFLNSDITEGTLVAYLVTQDDTHARRPLARILLKPYINQKTGETILVPGKIYGAIDDYRKDRRDTLSAKTKAAFYETALEWARTANNKKQGTFYINSNLYGDGELTVQNIKDHWDHQDLVEGLKQFRYGLLQEFLTEHSNKQNNVDWMSDGPDKDAAQAELNKEYRKHMAGLEDNQAIAGKYLRILKKTSLGAVPTRDQVIEASIDESVTFTNTIDSMARSSPTLALDYCLFEKRAGNPREELARSILEPAVRTGPELIFNKRYKELVYGHSYSEELIKNVSRIMPDSPLQNYTDYSEQPWAGEVLKIAAEKAFYPTALAKSAYFCREDYAQAIIQRAATENPSDALFSYHNFSGQPWALAILEAAVKKASPVAILRNYHQYSDRPWAEEVLEGAAKEASSSEMFDNISTIIDKEYARELLMEVAVTSPQDTLKNYRKYSDKPWSEEVLKTAVHHAKPEEVLSYAGLFKDKDYAKEVLFAAAKEVPDKAIHAYATIADQPWASEFLDIASHGASPSDFVTYDVLMKHDLARERLLEADSAHADSVLNNYTKYSEQPWAQEVLEKAVEHATSYSLFNNAEHYKATDFGERAIRQQAEADSHSAISYAKHFVDQPYAKEVLTKALESSPFYAETLIGECKGFEHLPHVQQLLCRCLDEKPEVAYTAPTKIDPRVCYEIAGQNVNKPWAASLKSAAIEGIQASGNAALDFIISCDHTEPWMEELARKACDPQHYISTHIKMKLIAKFSDSKWAGPAFVNLYDKDGYYSDAAITALQASDQLKAHSWAAEILADIPKRHASSVLSGLDSIIDIPDIQSVVCEAVKHDYDPMRKLLESTFFEQSWAGKVLAEVAKTKPYEVLAASQHYKEKDYAPEVFKEAAQSAVQISPRAAIEYFPLYANAPEARNILRQAVQNLNTSDDYSKDRTLLEYANLYAGQDYAQKIITDAAKRSPAYALVYSENFEGQPWGAAVISNAALATRNGKGNTSAILENAAKIYGKEFITKAPVVGILQWKITGESLIKKAAATTPYFVGSNADKIIEIPGGDELLRRAIKKDPSCIVGCYGGTKWHSEPWAEEALQFAYRSAAKSDPSHVVRSLMYQLENRSWAQEIRDSAYVALVKQNPKDALVIARDYTNKDLPVDAVRMAYDKLSKTDPKAAESFTYLPQLVKPVSPAPETSVTAEDQTSNKHDFASRLERVPASSGNDRAQPRSGRNHPSVASIRRRDIKPERFRSSSRSSTEEASHTR